MRGFVFDTKSGADKFAKALSKAWGERFGGVPLPRVEDASVGGKRRGSGRHAPWPRTERYAHVLTRSTDSKRAVRLTKFIESLDGETLDTGDGDEVTVDTRNATDLDETWEADDVARERVKERSNGARS